MLPSAGLMISRALRSGGSRFPVLGSWFLALWIQEAHRQVTSGLYPHLVGWTAWGPLALKIRMPTKPFDRGDRLGPEGPEGRRGRLGLTREPRTKNQQTT